ncbi:MAG TPA: cyclic nucleotide-binding domain-containing protein [Terriglobales bacterium]|nr:cyclic nucleotide-binding domain-containing protein [Terriglobales bacterium]
MRTTSNGFRLEPNSGISPTGIKKLNTSFDPETFLLKAGVGKTVVNLKKKDAAFSQGEPADAVFYIQQGRVKLTVVSQNGKEATLALLGFSIPARNAWHGSSCYLPSLARHANPRRGFPT